MTIRHTTLILATCALLAAPAAAQAPHRRALLIGIDDYTASTLPRPPRFNADEHRGWPDLKGAANDAGMLRDMLVLVYGFDPRDIVVLKNQQATRDAILQAIEQHLVKPAARGDVVFYSFAGHGSQVPNPASDEPDHLDESIVPADSRLGAPDIRDKELRASFNRILDRGAHLTLLLDHCHSGSGFRGLPTGARPRGIRPAREIVDAKRYGPRPDERGALVLASAQDRESAWEVPGDDGRMHGAFTWAWIRAMRDAAAGEPAQETFLRAQARLRGDRPDQTPVMLGRAEARLRPFLGRRVDRRGDRTVVAVEKVDADGTVVLQGGWANGLSAGTTLRAAAARLRITTILGLGRSIARLEPGSATLSAGALAEVTAWAAPPVRPMRVWAARDVLPFAPQLLSSDGIVPVDDPRLADYILMSRHSQRGMQYAWVRPLMRDTDRRASGLPQRTAWVRSPASLRHALVNLRRIHAWNVVESPPGTAAPYRLALRREKTKELVRDGTLLGGETYSVVLRARQPLSTPAPPRYYYLFVIDTHGRSYLAFPKTGSVENRFPLDDPAPPEIPLGPPSAFAIRPPYGVDTYVLLSTDEPLPNPSILEWDGVRTPRILTASRWSIERVSFESRRP